MSEKSDERLALEELWGVVKEFISYFPHNVPISVPSQLTAIRCKTLDEFIQEVASYRNIIEYNEEINHAKTHKESKS